MRSDEVDKWTRSLERVLKKMPSDIEIAVCYGSIQVLLAGTMDRGLESTSFELSDNIITTICGTDKVIPFSESM